MMDEAYRRLWENVERRGPDECWPWRASGNNYGYGRFSVGARKVLSHRVAYESANGPILEGALVCHRCDNPRCCNPAHLFLGTHADNMRDMQEKGRIAVGSRNARSKLVEQDVDCIRKLYATGIFTQGELAKAFGLSLRTANRIICRAIWRHVT